MRKTVEFPVSTINHLINDLLGMCQERCSACIGTEIEAEVLLYAGCYHPDKQLKKDCEIARCLKHCNTAHYDLKRTTGWR